jgi:hypothetical protein
MNERIADGARLNTILGKRVFKHGRVTDAEVIDATGLSIIELVTCWLFDTRNDFQKALCEWRQSGEPMRFDEIQRH